MARMVPLKSGEKALRDCSLTEIEAMAGDAKPASPIRGNVDDPKASYAKLAETMRQEAATTVGDIGEDAIRRWEQMLGLNFPSFDQIAKGLSKDPPKKPSKSEQEPSESKAASDF